MDNQIFFPNCDVTIMQYTVRIHSLTKKNNYKGVEALYIEYSVFSKNGIMGQKEECFATHQNWVPVINDLWNEQYALHYKPPKIDHYISESLF